MTAFADKLYHGAAYYPELWPDRVEDDIRLMLEAGIGLVRVGEFAWSSMEPEEGVYELEWLQEVFDRCAAAGIDVILCTPTPTPPRWLTAKYPEVLRVDRDGRAFQHGSRQHVSHTSPVYREFSRKITEELAAEFGRHAALVGWQTDNEFLCHVDGDYGPWAEKAWHTHLAEKYETVETLNRFWSTDIWSETYPSFESIPMPAKTPFHNTPGLPDGQHHVSLAKEWGHFVAETVAAFQAEQVEIIRRHSDAPVTHNHVSRCRCPAEVIMRDLDLAATDAYVAAEGTWKVLPTLDWMRGAKMGADRRPRPFWILETAPSHNGGTEVGHATHPDGYLRAEAALYLAMGGTAFCYWLWQQQRSGVEMCHGHVVTAWGTPGVAWDNVRAVSEIIETLEALLTELLPTPADLAFHDTGSNRIHLFRAEKLWPEVSPHATLRDEFYVPLLKRGIWRDVRFEGADVSGYKVVLTPLAPVLTDELLDRMEAYLKQGGTWVVGPMSGCRTEYGTVPTDAGLGRLDELAGVRTLYPVGIRGCKGTLGGEEIDLGWYSFGLEPATDACHVLGTYRDGPAAGTAWCVERSVGEGRIVLLASHTPGGYGRLLDHVLAGYDLAAYPSSWGTTVVPRGDGERRACVVVNWNGEGGTAELPMGGRDLVSDQPVEASTVRVDPFGVMAVVADEG